MPLFLAACSTLPERAWPRLDERSVVATWQSAAREVEVPVSSPHLTILELVPAPAPSGERWVAGRRWLVLPRDGERFVVRCRYRAYDAGHGVPAPQDLFPGAVVVEGP